MVETVKYFPLSGSVFAAGGEVFMQKTFRISSPANYFYLHQIFGMVIFTPVAGSPSIFPATRVEITQTSGSTTGLMIPSGFEDLGWSPSNTMVFQINDGNNWTPIKPIPFFGGNSSITFTFWIYTSALTAGDNATFQFCVAHSSSDSLKY